MRGVGLVVAAVGMLGWAVMGEGAAPLSSSGAALGQVVAEARDQSLELGVRLQSIGALGKWASPEVRGPLLELLKDPAYEIRDAAARGLGWPGNTAAVGALQARAVDQGEEATVRVGAIGSLVRIGDKGVRGALVQLSVDPNAEVREAALRGLIEGPLQSGADRRALATRAAEDEALGLPFRVDAIKVLTATRDPGVIPTLVKLLETGPREKIVSPPAGATQQQMLAVRYQQIGDVRAWAAQGLGELGDRAVVPQLVKATEDRDDFFLRYIAAGVLVNWQERGQVPVLVGLLKDPSSEVRTVAVIGVGVLGDGAQVGAVGERLVKDEVATVRVKAAEALTALGESSPGAREEARGRLQAAQATEKDPQVRQALDTALARLKR